MNRDKSRSFGCLMMRWGDAGAGAGRNTRSLAEVWVWALCWLRWWFQGCIHVSKLIKLYTKNMCSLLHANHTSIKLFAFLKNPNNRTTLSYAVPFLSSSPDFPIALPAGPTAIFVTAYSYHLTIKLSHMKLPMFYHFWPKKMAVSHGST